MYIGLPCAAKMPTLLPGYLPVSQISTFYRWMSRKGRPAIMAARTQCRVRPMWSKRLVLNWGKAPVRCATLFRREIANTYDHQQESKTLIRRYVLRFIS